MLRVTAKLSPLSMPMVDAAFLVQVIVTEPLALLTDAESGSYVPNDRLVALIVQLLNTVAETVKVVVAWSALATLLRPTSAAVAETSVRSLRVGRFIAIPFL